MKSLYKTQMNCELQLMRENVISTILSMEKQKIGRAIRNQIHFNTPAYYSPFEQLYQANTEVFICALCDMGNGAETESQYSTMDQKAEIRQYLIRIPVHALRLRLYFGIRISEIPELLKNLFLYSFQLQKSTDCWVARDGFWLNLACSDLLESVSVGSDSPKKQLYYSDTFPHALSFEHFITLREVTDVYSANLYQQCYRYGYVTEYPAYIRQALKASWLYDQLVTPAGWNDYFYKHSADRIQKNLSLFKSIGFEKISSLMKEMLEVLQQRSLADGKGKRHFCDKMISRFHNQIQNCISDETSAIIDQFLCNHIA